MRVTASDLSQQEGSNGNLSMPRLRVKGIVFDLYGTVVDVGAVAAVCKDVTPDPIAFDIQ